MSTQWSIGITHFDDSDGNDGDDGDDDGGNDDYYEERRNVFCYL